MAMKTGSIPLPFQILSVHQAFPYPFGSLDWSGSHGLMQSVGNAVSINTVKDLSSHLTTPGALIHWENWLMKGWLGVVKPQRHHTCWYFTWFWKSRCHHLVDDTYPWRNSVEEWAQQPREAGKTLVLHLINNPRLWRMRPALAASSRSSPQLWGCREFLTFPHTRHFL